MSADVDWAGYETSIEVDGIESERRGVYVQQAFHLVEEGLDLAELADRSFRWEPGLPVLRFGGAS